MVNWFDLPYRNVLSQGMRLGKKKPRSYNLSGATTVSNAV